MSRNVPVLLLFLCAPLGCMRSLDVRQSGPLTASAAPARLPGIPFYAKTGACQQQSIWLEPQYTIAFESEGKTQQLTVDRHTYLSQNLKTLFANPTSATWEAVRKTPPLQMIDENDGKAIGEQQSLGNWQLVANTASVLSIVDYTHVLYLNSARPLAGSAQATAKLGADGTLAEGSAQVEDKTLATVVTAIGSLASTASTAGAMAAIHLPGDSDTVTATPHFYLHTHTSLSATADPLACKPATPALYAGSFTVSEPAAAPKPPDPDAISVSGTVKLPAPKP